MSESIIQQLKKFLETAADWESMETESDGIKVVKVPATKTRKALLNIEFNPIRDGRQVKRKGLFVSSAEMHVLFAELLTHDDAYQIVKCIDEINPSNIKLPVKKLKMG